MNALTPKGWQQGNAELKDLIAELEAIVVQQRDGFFEQDKRIAELQAKNERLREQLQIGIDIEARLAESEADADLVRKCNDSLMERIAELERENKRLDDHAKKWGIKAQWEAFLNRLGK